MDWLPILLEDGIPMDVMEHVVQDFLQPLPDFGLCGVERRERNRNENYYERIIPTYTNDQFKEHFRMSRTTYEELTTVISNKIQGNPNLYAPLPKKLLFSLWILSKPESFLSVGDRFDFSPSSGHQIFKEIIQVLVNLIPEYIQWPNDYKRQQSVDAFEARSYGFPGAVGAIDGCHIPCKQPVRNAVDFYNRKGFHSIILQGTCDHQRRFIDTFVGLPGRMHDANVFKHSPLHNNLNDENNPLLPRHQHLLGDSANPLSEFLLTPFKNTGHLTAAKACDNVKLSGIRAIIERAFELLKGKFRRLKYLDIADFVWGTV